MLAFKRSGNDVHHVGLVTGEGTVIHSSSAAGRVVETELDDSWHMLAVHRYIEVSETQKVESVLPEDRMQAAQDVPGIVILDSAGNRFEPVGDFRVLIGGVD